MALSPLFWNNGWSSQLSLSLDSLIPLMHCAVCPCGGLLIEGGVGGDDEKTTSLQAFQKCCLKGCGKAVL